MTPSLSYSMCILYSSSTHAFKVECFRAFYQSFSGKFWIYFSNWVGCKNAEKDLRKLKSGFSHFQQKLRGYQDQQQYRIIGWLQRQRTCSHNLVKNQTACVAFNTCQCIIIILPRDFLRFYVHYNSCVDDKANFLLLCVFAFKTTCFDIIAKNIEVETWTFSGRVFPNDCCCCQRDLSWSHINI